MNLLPFDSLYLNNSLNHSKLNWVVAAPPAIKRKMSYHPCPIWRLSGVWAALSERLLQSSKGDGGVFNPPTQIECSWENPLSERFEPVMFGCLNSVDSHGLSFFVCQRRYCPTKHQWFGRKLKNKFSKNLKSVWGWLALYSYPNL